MSLPYGLKRLNGHVKTKLNDQTEVKHFLKLVIPSQFRDLILATRLLGQPLPKEVVPVLNEMTEKFSNTNSYVRVWKRLVKAGDMIAVSQTSCSYCSGSGLCPGFNNPTAVRVCWNCSGKGKLDAYRYVGPTI